MRGVRRWMAVMALCAVAACTDDAARPGVDADVAADVGDASDAVTDSVGGDVATDATGTTDGGEDAAETADGDATDVVEDATSGDADDTVVADVEDTSDPDAGDTDGDADSGATDAVEDTQIVDTSDDDVDTSDAIADADDAKDGADDADVGPTYPLRILAGNLTTTAQKWAGPGQRILQAMGPDIAILQEAQSASGSFRSFVTATFGADFEVVVGAGTIPNAVVSRHPFLSSGEWDDPDLSDREFTWARVDLPGDTEAWVVSVHFKSGSSDANRRATSAQALVNFIVAHVPPGDFVVLGGDFNTYSREEAAVVTLADVFVTAGPYPADADGNDQTNANRNHPYDWVLVDSHLDVYQTPTYVGPQVFADGLVFDTRVFTPITDAPPALTSDSSAPQMQHMAVVRDFLVPLD